MLEHLSRVRNKALQAAIIAKAWYTLLQTAIDRGDLKLNHPYDGLVITSIWDSRPIAWRPRPCYQFEFTLNDLPLDNYPRIAGDPVKGYFDAYRLEKDAWAEYDAEYQKTVTAYLRNELDTIPIRSNGYLSATTLKIYEVKPIK